MNFFIRFLKFIYNKLRIIPLNIFCFLKKDFSMLFRKKKYLFLSILLPLLLGIIYILILTSNQENFNFYVCDFDNTTLTKSVLSSLNNVKTNSNINCVENLTNEIKMRKSLFGIVINKGFTNNIENYQKSLIQVYYDNSDPSISSIVSWKIEVLLMEFKNKQITSFVNSLKDKTSNAQDKTQFSLKVINSMNNVLLLDELKKPIQEIDYELNKITSMDSGFVSSPITVVQKGVFQDFKMIELGIAPLFVILSFFLILMLSSTTLIYDKKIGLFSRIRASNGSMFSYLLSKNLFYFFICVCEFIIIYLIFLLFGAHFNINFLSLFFTLVFISFVNSLIGVLIGLVSDSEGVSVLISLVITLPMFFLSGLFYPIEIMPKGIIFLSKLIPFGIEISFMKQAILFDSMILFKPFLIVLFLFVISLYFLNKVRV